MGIDKTRDNSHIFCIYNSVCFDFCFLVNKEDFIRRYSDIRFEWLGTSPIKDSAVFYQHVYLIHDKTPDKAILSHGTLIRIDDTAVCNLPSGRGLRKSLSSREDNKINEFLRHSL